MSDPPSIRRGAPRRSGPGRLAAADAALLPEQLLDAAQAVFVETGYARATMDAIARAAGTTRKTLYARYANKAEVLTAVVNRLLDRAVPPLVASTQPAGTPHAQLRSLGRQLALLSAAPEVAGLNRLMLAEAAQVPELGRLFIDLHARATHAVLARLRALLAEGHLRKAPANLEAAAALFIEMNCSLPRLAAMLGRPMTARQLTTQVDLAVELFLAGCGEALAG
jgi:TetR/AcrR family transcriptional repressor of mexJK operon